MLAEWHLFATSHGKSACHSAGGTLKRLATKASLQRPYDHQILTTKDLCSTEHQRDGFCICIK